MLNSEMGVVRGHGASIVSVVRNKSYAVFVLVLHTQSWAVAWLTGAPRGRPVVSRADERCWCGAHVLSSPSPCSVPLMRRPLGLDA